MKRRAHRRLAHLAPTLAPSPVIGGRNDLVFQEVLALSQQVDRALVEQQVIR